MSCATEDDDASVSPATTARIVANATEAMNARKKAPPVVPAPPPSSSASCGAAVLPPGLAARIALVPTSAAAPKPSARVSR